MSPCMDGARDARRRTRKFGKPSVRLFQMAAFLSSRKIGASEKHPSKDAEKNRRKNFVLGSKTAVGRKARRYRH
ncbi:MAG: hypothetical protein ACK40X_06740 [Armatimonadota bacterium]